MPDEYKDLKLGRNRDIQLTAGKDLGLTTEFKENISQSVSISIGDALQNVIGGPRDADTLQSLTSEIKQVLEDDIQVGRVLSVRITEVNEVEQSVTADVEMLEDEDFEITLI